MWQSNYGEPAGGGGDGYWPGEDTNFGKWQRTRHAFRQNPAMMQARMPYWGPSQFPRRPMNPLQGSYDEVAPFQMAAEAFQPQNQIGSFSQMSQMGPQMADQESVQFRQQLQRQRHQAAWLAHSPFQNFADDSSHRSAAQGFSSPTPSFSSVSSTTTEQSAGEVTLRGGLATPGAASAAENREQDMELERMLYEQFGVAYARTPMQLRRTRSNAARSLVLKPEVHSAMAMVTWDRPNVPVQCFKVKIHGHEYAELVFPPQKLHVRMKVEPGQHYRVEVTAAGMMSGFDAGFGVCEFRSVMSRDELVKLYHRSADFVVQPRPDMSQFFVFYRNKPEEYFRKTMYQDNNVMIKYLKDLNGQPGCPINQLLRGLFFSARLLRGRDLPTGSCYGETRFCIEAGNLFHQHTRLYFCDFYCNDTRQAMHYVTLVLAMRGSLEDAWCEKSLVELNPNDNVFLCMKQNRMKPGGYEYFINNNLWIEIFYTEDVPLQFGRIDKVNKIGKGTSTPGGQKNRRDCRICNLYPEVKGGSHPDDAVVPLLESLSRESDRPPSRRRSSDRKRSTTSPPIKSGDDVDLSSKRPKLEEEERPSPKEEDDDLEDEFAGTGADASLLSSRETNTSTYNIVRDLTAVAAQRGLDGVGFSVRLDISSLVCKLVDDVVASAGRVASPKPSTSPPPNTASGDADISCVGWAAAAGKGERDLPDWSTTAVTETVVEKVVEVVDEEELKRQAALEEENRILGIVESPARKRWYAAGIDFKIPPALLYKPEPQPDDEELEALLLSDMDISSIVDSFHEREKSRQAAAAAAEFSVEIVKEVLAVEKQQQQQPAKTGPTTGRKIAIQRPSRQDSSEIPKPTKLKLKRPSIQEVSNDLPTKTEEKEAEVIDLLDDSSSSVVIVAEKKDIQSGTSCSLLVANRIAADSHVTFHVPERVKVSANLHEYTKLPEVVSWSPEKREEALERAKSLLRQCCKAQPRNEKESAPPSAPTSPFNPPANPFMPSDGSPPASPFMPSDSSTPILPRKKTTSWKPTQSSWLDVTLKSPLVSKSFAAQVLAREFAKMPEPEKDPEMLAAAEAANRSFERLENTVASIEQSLQAYERKRMEKSLLVSSPLLKQS